MLYRPLAADEVRKSFESSAKPLDMDMDRLRSEYVKMVRGPRAAYIGGEKALAFLIKRKAESQAKWEERQRFFHNVRVVRVFCDTLASLVYGAPYPRRSWWLGDAPPDVATQAEALLAQMRGEDVDVVTEDADSAEFSEWALGVYRDNEAAKLFRDLLGGKFDRNQEWEYGRLCDGAAAVKVYPVWGEEGEDFGRVRSLKFAGYSYENAWPIPHPDDRDYIAAVVEARQFGEKTAYRLWTHEGFTWVDSALKPIPTPPGAREPEDIGLGMPTFAFLGDGQGWMGDAVIDQRSAINQYSAYEFIKAAQGSALGVLQGNIRNKPQTTDDGQKRVAVGDIDFLWLEDAGEFDWKSPQAPLDDHLEGIQSFLSQTYKAHGLPDDLIRESSGTEKPLAMLFRWLPAMTQRKNLLPEAKAFERQMAQLVAAYTEVYADDLQLAVADRADVGFDVAFTDNPLPQDAKENEESLRARWKDGLILTTEYIYQMDPELSAQEIAEKAFALEREQERRNKSAPRPQTQNGTTAMSDEDMERMMAEEAETMSRGGNP